MKKRRGVNKKKLLRWVNWGLKKSKLGSRGLSKLRGFASGRIKNPMAKSLVDKALSMGQSYAAQRGYGRSRRNRIGMGINLTGGMMCGCKHRGSRKGYGLRRAGN
jgi:hypothetical protein